MKKIDKEDYLIASLSSKHIGDDAAVIGETLYSMDAFFEDVHFKRAWMTMRQIGRKAMLVNLSDAVAMNAQPQYALVTLSLPPDLTLHEIDALSQSLESTAAAYGCEIIGGDTIGGDKLHLSIALISHSSNPLLRTTLREGDLLAYTGVLGGSKEGLDALFRGESIADDARFYEPILRAEFIRDARAFLHAGMDISDGLYCDTNKLLDINGYGFESLLALPDEVGLSGEEYEMLVSFDANDLETLESIAQRSDTELTVFAKVVKGDKRFPCKSHHFDGGQDDADVSL